MDNHRQTCLFRTCIFITKGIFTDLTKTALGATNDKIIRSIDTMETYAYGTNEELIQTNEEI